MLEDIIENAGNAINSNAINIIACSVVVSLGYSTRVYAMKLAHLAATLLGKNKRVYPDDNFSQERYRQFVEADQGGIEPEVQIYAPAFAEEKDVLREVVRSAYSQNYRNSRVILVTSDKDTFDTEFFPREGLDRPATYRYAEELRDEFPGLEHIHVPGYHQTNYGRMDGDVSRFLNKGIPVFGMADKPLSLFLDEPQRISLKDSVSIIIGRIKHPFGNPVPKRTFGIATSGLEDTLGKIEESSAIKDAITTLNRRYGNDRYEVNIDSLTSAVYRAQSDSLPSVTLELVSEAARLYHTTYFDKQRGRLRRLTNNEILGYLNHNLRSDGYNGKELTERGLMYLLKTAEFNGQAVDWKKGKGTKLESATVWDRYLDYLVGKDAEVDMGWRRKLSEGRLPRRMKPGDVNYAFFAVNDGNFDAGPQGQKKFLTILDAEDKVRESDWLSRLNWTINHENYSAVQGRLLFAKNMKDGLLAFNASTEYAVHFRMFMPDAVGVGLPLPLSGTSYGMPFDVFDSIGGLDPYNQTEDAMAGLLLSARGHRLGYIRTHPFESAPTEIFGVNGNVRRKLTNWTGGWAGQRRRWAWGFLESIETAVRSKSFSAKDVAKSAFMMVYSPAFNAMNGIVMPIGAAWFGADFLDQQGLETGVNAPLWVTLTGYGNLAITAAQMGITAIQSNYSAHMAGIKFSARERLGWIAQVALQPFYWNLTALPSWAALYKYAQSKITGNEGEWCKTAHEHIPLPELQTSPILKTPEQLIGSAMPAKSAAAKSYLLVGGGK